MTFKETFKLVHELNIDYVRSLTFKAAVLIIYCSMNETWNVPDVWKASRTHQRVYFKKGEIEYIFNNLHENNLIYRYTWFNHNFSEDGLEFIVELTLLAGVAAGELVRYKSVFELPPLEIDQILLPEMCESLKPQPFVAPIYKPYEFNHRFSDIEL